MHGQEAREAKREADESSCVTYYLLTETTNDPVEGGYVSLHAFEQSHHQKVEHINFSGKKCNLQKM